MPTNINRYLSKLLVTSMAKVTPKTKKPSDMPTDDYCAIATFAFLFDKSMTSIWKRVKPYWSDAEPGKTAGMVTVNIVYALNYVFNKRPIRVAELEGKSLAYVMLHLSKAGGSYIIYTGNHVIGVKDGSYIDTAHSPMSTKVKYVHKIKSDTRIGKCVIIEIEQGGETLRGLGIYYGNGTVYVRSPSNEGLIVPKKIKPWPNATPADLQKGYDAYAKANRTPYGSK